MHDKQISGQLNSYYEFNQHYYHFCIQLVTFCDVNRPPWLLFIRYYLKHSLYCVLNIEVITGCKFKVAGQFFTPRPVGDHDCEVIALSAHNFKITHIVSSILKFLKTDAPTSKFAFKLDFIEINFSILLH